MGVPYIVPSAFAFRSSPVVAFGVVRFGLDDRSSLDFQPSIDVAPPPGGRRGLFAATERLLSVMATLSRLVVDTPLISHQWTPSRRSHVIAAIIGSVVILTVIAVQAF